MKKALFTISTILCFNLATFARPQVYAWPPETVAARGAALQWLKLVDTGQYAASWDRAAKSFQNKISKDEWVEGMEKIRSRYGEVLLRGFSGATRGESAPEASQGGNEILRFSIRLGIAGPAMEVVSVEQENSGEWRVSGYGVTPANIVQAR